MARGPLYQSEYRPQFSGHETFPLRYGWLKKAYDRVAESESDPENRAECWGGDAIAKFGVGKNMVASIRHWASVTKIIEEPTGTSTVRTTPLGQKILGPEGTDPYLENPSTLWLMHWQLAALPEKTTWFWAFNHYPAVTFSREHFVNRLERLARDQTWSRVAKKTVQNDVACFVRTYAVHQSSRKLTHDDALESPLTELGLVKAIGKNDGFRFVRGPKSTLGQGVFTYALIDFWLRHSNASTLSFEAIAHEPGSPGRVFLLDENDVVDRLAALDETTNGRLRWSETAGLKQVVRESDFTIESAIAFINADYESDLRQEAA